MPAAGSDTRGKQPLQPRSERRDMHGLALPTRHIAFPWVPAAGPAPSAAAWLACPCHVPVLRGRVAYPWHVFWSRTRHVALGTRR